ncbi:MAG: PhoH family protein, partial [Cellulosimicrobium funkei]
DATQVDLPGGTQSGLRVIQDVLTGVDDVEFCRLTSSDVVRHRLVSDIIDAYARWDLASGGGSGSSGSRRRDDDRRGRPAARERRTRDDA